MNPKIQFIVIWLLMTISLSIQAIETNTPSLEFVGKIVKISVEGGFYGIESEKGDKYNPLNLPDLLRENGLWVQVKAEPVKDKLGIHLWGSYIRIQSIAVIPCPTTP